MKLLDTSVVVDIDRGGIDRKVRKLDDQGRHLLSMVTVGFIPPLKGWAFASLPL